MAGFEWKCVSRHVDFSELYTLCFAIESVLCVDREPPYFFLGLLLASILFVYFLVLVYICANC